MYHLDRVEAQIYNGGKTIKSLQHGNFNLSEVKSEKLRNQTLKLCVILLNDQHDSKRCSLRFVVIYSNRVLLSNIMKK